MNYRLLVGAALAALGTGTGFAWGQFAASPNPPSYVEATAISSELDLHGTISAARRASNLYARAAKDPSLTNGIVQESLFDTYGLNHRTDSFTKLLALQAAQNARIIEQNDEIIALLKKQKN